MIESEQFLPAVGARLSQPQHIRSGRSVADFQDLSELRGCCGWDSRGPTARCWRGVLLALAGLALATTGCGTFDKAPASKFASVRIEGNTPGQIRDAAAAVFRDHGFKVTLGKTNLVCEKEGSGMDNFAYGNWMGGEPVWLRVKVTIVPLSEGTFRLQCLAYKVRDKGSFAFEEEVQVSRMSSRPYRKMLEEVAARLRGPP